jgi:hypothetical protein
VQSTLGGELDKLIALRTKDLKKQVIAEIAHNFSVDAKCISFKDSGLTKMVIGVLPNKDNIATPIMVFGAGDGYGNNRGYLEKQTDGLSLYYVGNLSAGEVSYIKLTKDTLDCNGYEVHTKKTAIVDAYLASASWWNATVQNLDINGDATSMNIQTSGTGARIKLTDGGVFQGLNSSGQKHGFYIDSNSDIYLYYNNYTPLKISPGSNYWELLGYYSGSYYSSLYWFAATTYPKGNWDFSYATVTGL